MTRFILLRIGETIANVEKRIGNQTSLTENGVKEVHKAAKRLTRTKIDHIFTSSLGSAVETGKIIADHLKIAPQIYSEFNEADLGRWDGLLKKDLEKQEPEIWKKFIAGPGPQFRFPGGESFQELHDRGLKKINEIVKEYPDKTILIITHGFLIRLFICSLLGINLKESWIFHQFNTNITAFEYNGQKPKFHVINDIGHLFMIDEPIGKFGETMTGKNPWFF